MATREAWAGYLRALLPRRSDLYVVLADVRALLAGRCNHRPSDGALDHERHGYDHWRCLRRRRHGGKHRAHNYVWPVEGSGYDPVDSDEQRFAALAANTLDVDPLPWHTAERIVGSSYTQRARRVAWQVREDARRGWGPPTPGQVLGLLRRPRAVLAALTAARRLEREMREVPDDLVLDRLREFLDNARVPR